MVADLWQRKGNVSGCVKNNSVSFPAVSKSNRLQEGLKGPASSSMPCTCHLLVCLCCRYFMGHEKAITRPTRRRHVQGMLDKTDPPLNLVSI